jgi:hypothetical protein
MLKNAAGSEPNSAQDDVMATIEELEKPNMPAGGLPPGCR